jgi:transcriptional regulator with GAF, ATPase, and Fis domain
LKPGQGIAGWVLKERRPALVNDVQKDSRFYSKVDILTGFKTRSILAVPLTYHDRTIGVIEALNTVKEKRFEQSDLELLSILAAHASVAIRTAKLVSSIKEENRYLQAELGERYRTLIGESGPMKKAVDTAHRAAESRSTVLLLGESGVGKEIIARSIHNWSPRAQRPFVAVNCVALAEHLLESELLAMKKAPLPAHTSRRRACSNWLMVGRYFWTRSVI